jgi:SAM-dependent methyltransferase
MGYDLAAFGSMIADTTRIDSYVEALRRTVTPESLVLDIGAGTGIMSLIAAQLGARRVIAVEPNSLVRIGARLAVENGVAERIRFVHGRSQELELTELADVVVCDLRGGLPTVAEHVDAMVDARRRLMKPGAILIPAHDTIFVAPVDAEKAHAELVSPWRKAPLKLRMAGAEHAILNQGLAQMKEPGSLLGEGRPLVTMESAVLESASFERGILLPIARDGVVSGLALWFETELVPGVGFSTSPDLDRTVYGRVFLPLPSGIAVAAGDRVRATVKAVIEHDENMWIWRGSVASADGASKGSFASSTVFFNPENEAVLEVLEDDCRPGLSMDGKVAWQVLEGMDAGLSVVELANRIVESHPGRFECLEDALRMVRRLGRGFGAPLLRIES